MKQNWIVFNAKDKDFVFENFADLSLLTAMLKLPWVTWIDKYWVFDNVGNWNSINDVWQQGWEYNFTENSGKTYAMSSTNTNDSQPMRITVYTVDWDQNWNMETFDQSLNWQNKVILTPSSGDPIVRILMMENEADGGAWAGQWDTQGDVYIYEDTNDISNWKPDDEDLIRQEMSIWYNQSEMLIYTVPTWYVWFLLRWETWVGKWSWTDQIQMEYRSRRYWKVFKTKKSITLQTGWSSIYRDVRSVKDPIPAKTDLLLRSVYASANSMSIWGTFDILLVDERQLDDKYLQAIWQIKRVWDYPSPILNIW